MAECSHDEWEIRGDNRVGYGTCSVCHKEVNLLDLFNRLKFRMETALNDCIKKKGTQDGHG